MNGLKKQTFVLSISYLSFIIFDSIVMLIANLTHKRDNGNFICTGDGNNLEAQNNKASIILLLFALSIMGFSFVMWYTFYKIPEKLGLISKAKATDKLVLKLNTSEHDE